MMTIASLLGFTGSDLIVILLIVFLLLAAQKLPALGESLGQVIQKLTKASDESEREPTRPREPAEHSAGPRAPWRFILVKLHDGYATAATAPFPLLH